MSGQIEMMQKNIDILLLTITSADVIREKTVHVLLRLQRKGGLGHDTHEEIANLIVLNGGNNAQT